MAADSLVDMIINQKADFQVTFYVKESGVAKNLAGYTSSAKLKSDYTTPDSQSIEFTTAVDEANGAVTISLTHTQTANLDLQRYVYDVTITSPQDFKTRIVEGKVTVSGGVS